MTVPTETVQPDDTMLMMRLMNKFFPDCEEVSRLVSQNLDERLPWSRRLGMRIHTMMCHWCRRHSRQQSLIQRLIRRRGPDELPSGAGMSSQAKDRIERLLSDAGDADRENR